jgi:hypothetical protein
VRLEFAVDEHDQPAVVDAHERVGSVLEHRGLGRQAPGDVAVDLDQPGELLVGGILCGSAAFDDQSPAVLGVLHQVALPAVCLGDDPLDLLQHERILGTQQILRASAEGFLERVPVGVLSAPVSKVMRRLASRAKIASRTGGR